MKNKAFTLVELLAILAVLAAILLIAVPLIISVISDMRQNVYDENVNIMEKAARNYLLEHSDSLPQVINDNTTISLGTLLNNNFISEIVDPISKNPCDSDESKVIITKSSATEYSYDVTLVCDNYGSIYVDENDNINPIVAVYQNIDDVDVYGFDDNYMLFDNSNDYINVPYNAAQAPTSAITFGAWVYSNDWTKPQWDDTIISKTETGGYNCNIDDAGSGGGGFFSCLVRRNGAYATLTYNYTSLTPGWHLLMITYDGRYTKLYLDNALQSTNDAGANYPIQYSYANNLFIGTEAGTGTTPGNGSYLYEGKMSDVRIYNSALTVEQISTIYNDNRQDTDPDLEDFASSLVGYWKINEGSGTTAYDSSTTQNDGAINGSPVWTTLNSGIRKTSVYTGDVSATYDSETPVYTTPTSHLSISNLPKGVYTFVTKDYGNNTAVKVYNIQSYTDTILMDGSNDTVRVAYDAALAPTTAISYGGWIYRFDWSSYYFWGGAFISKTETGGYNIQADADRGNNYIGAAVRRNGGYAEVKTNYTSFSSGWHFMMTTYDGQYTKFYVDGVLKATNDAGAVYPIQYSYSNSLIIGGEASTGASPYSTDFFKGIMSEIRIYDIALTEAQVNVIYDDNRQNADPDLSAFSSNLQGYWRLNEGTGTTAYDSSGNGRNATIYGSPTWITE